MTITERVLEAILECREVDVVDVRTALERVRSGERAQPHPVADRIDLLEQIARQAKVVVDTNTQFIADCDSDDAEVDPGLTYDRGVEAMDALRALVSQLPVCDGVT